MSRTQKKSPSQGTSLTQRITELERKQAELELELVRERGENQRLRVNSVRLQQLLERLREENEALKREGKRQATPFARRKRVELRKKPGRKAGQGSRNGISAFGEMRNRAGGLIFRLPGVLSKFTQRAE